MNNRYEELIAGYFEGNLSPEEDQMLQQLIESGEIDLIEIEAMRQLHDQLDMIRIPQPSDEMSKNFYQMLENAQDKKSGLPNTLNSIATWLNEKLSQLTVARIGYASALVIAGFLIGATLNSSSEELEQLSEEMQSLREMMMVSLLEGPSTTDRLRAVTISATIPEADSKAIRALLFTLNNDESVNVRVQAVDALMRWSGNETVREGLVKSITHQNDDMVIISLADAMVELGMRQSAGEFEKLMKERELNELTKTKLENSIAVLM